MEQFLVGSELPHLHFGMLFVKIPKMFWPPRIIENCQQMNVSRWNRFTSNHIADWLMLHHLIIYYHFCVTSNHSQSLKTREISKIYLDKTFEISMFSYQKSPGLSSRTFCTIGTSSGIFSSASTCTSSKFTFFVSCWSKICYGSDYELTKKKYDINKFKTPNPITVI